MASLALVADYSSSEEEETAGMKVKLPPAALKQPTNFFETGPDIEPSQKKLKKCKKSKKEKHMKLINPKKGLMNMNAGGHGLPNPFQSDETSVFYNPFHKEQEAKKLMLEKHVKLSENPKDVVEINGKKICFNYRKGRCKFGHNCKYAHDSDLSNTATSGGGATGTHPSQGVQYNNGVPDDGLGTETEEERVRKRKPGLSEGLMPNKRARQNFRSQQTKETPWLAKR